MRHLLFKIMVCFGILSMIMGCSPKQTEKSQNENEEMIYPVKTQDIRKDTITRTLEYTSDLSAWESVHFAPATPGRIEDIYVDVGDHVSEGETLVKMNTNKLRQARTKLQSARSNFQRIDTLYQLGSISEQKYEQAKTQYEIAQANVEYLEENTTMSSPLNGMVTHKYYEPREMYSAAPNTKSGKSAILTLMQIHHLKAYADIPERFFTRLREEMKVDFTIDMFSDTTFKGEIHRIHPTINETSRTFQVEISVDNPRELLRPGMFARLEIELKHTPALIVPAIAVMQEEGTNNRFLFVKEGKTARKVDVRIGQRFDDQFEVISRKLHEDMPLIVAGQSNLTDGAKIRVK